MERYERISFHRTCRGISDGMQAKRIRRNTGSPSGDCSMDQLAARERKAGLTGMAERLVVPKKPGSCEKTHPAKRRSTVVLLFIRGAVTRDSCLLNSPEPLRVLGRDGSIAAR